MTKRKASKRAKPKVKVGHSRKGPAPLYPFASLKKKGAYFDVDGESANYASIRAQASKKGKALGIKFSVEKTTTGVRVWFDHNLNARTGSTR